MKKKEKMAFGRLDLMRNDLLPKNKKIKIGFVGGGPNSFIGYTHRLAARFDNRFDFVAGVFSRDIKKSKEFGISLGLDPSRCYSDYKSMAEIEKKIKEFTIIRNRIVKNQGKTMRTKRGVVFSYRVKKKSVISQYLMEYHKNDKNKGLGIVSNHIDSEKFIIYAEDKAISEKLLRTATESFFDVEGPTELKRYLGINNFDSRITHLWGILNDKRILKYKK